MFPVEKVVALRRRRDSHIKEKIQGYVGKTDYILKEIICLEVELNYTHFWKIGICGSSFASV